MKDVTVSPNNIIVDNIPNEHIEEFHKQLDLLRKNYNVRVRIKLDGRTSSKVYDFPAYSKSLYL